MPGITRYLVYLLIEGRGCKVHYSFRKQWTKGNYVYFLFSSKIHMFYSFFSLFFFSPTLVCAETYNPDEEEEKGQPGIRKRTSSADPPNWALVLTIHPTFPTFKIFLDSGMTWNTVPNLCLPLFAPKGLSVFFNCAEHNWFSQGVQSDVVFEKSWFGNFLNYTVSKPIVALY